MVARAIVRSLLTRKAIEGSLQRFAFESGGDSEDDALRRALVTLSVAPPPNAFVVEFEEGALLVHRLP